MNNNNEWQWGEPEKSLDSMPEPSLDQNRILGKRYLCCGMDAEMRSFDKGDWVSYADYAKLRMERIHDLNQIGGLQEDNARLKAEVERLTREQRMKAIPVEAQLIDRIAELKAEVEQLKEGNEYLGQMHDKEMERSAYLCEQVERLEKGIQPEGSNDAVGRAVELLLEKEKEIARLNAEVERLRKAGDAMALNVYVPIQYEIYLKLISDWEAAKKGKPSV